MNGRHVDRMRGLAGLTIALALYANLQEAFWPDGLNLTSLATLEAMLFASYVLQVLSHKPPPSAD